MRLLDWCSDHVGLLVTAGVVGLIALFVVGYRYDQRQMAAQCGRLMAFAHTATDSLHAATECQRMQDAYAQRLTEAAAAGVIAGSISASRR